MIVKLLTEHHLEFLSLKGGCSGSSESTLVKCHIVGNHMSRLNYVLFNQTYITHYHSLYLNCRTPRCDERHSGLPGHALLVELQFSHLSAVYRIMLQISSIWNVHEQNF